MRRTIPLVASLLLVVSTLGAWPARAAAQLCLGREPTIVGSFRDDVITGTSGPDVISTGGGADVIHGRGGADRICSGSGDDRIFAGGGNDLTAPGMGDDMVNGGGGSDIVSFAGATGSVEATTEGSTTGQGADALQHVEGFVGSRFDDVLLVGYPNYLHLGYAVWGGAGDDLIRDGSPLSGSSIHGGPGDDRISTGGGWATVRGGPGNDEIDLVSREGSADGGPGDDEIWISGAWVEMAGGPGDDRLGSDGCGFPTVSYANAEGPVIVDLAAGTATGQGQDQLVGVDRVFGSRFSDMMVAGRAHECLGYPDWGSSLGGGGGDDLLVGGNGMDSLFGGSGDDTMAGRLGDDDLWGDDGIDRADGGPGIDRCSAEELMTCEETAAMGSWLSAPPAGNGFGAGPRP
jgi:Ca2+-binding RTX toxin-like protein